MIDLRHENDTATLRTDGRKLNEMRQVSFELGTMQNANGSAIFTIGNTKVAAFVQGPHQINQRGAGQTLGGVQSQNKGILNVRFFQTNFSAMEHKANIKKDLKMKEFCRVLKSVFEQVLMLENYPRSQIDLQVFVLQADGGYRSAAFNAVSLALMDAGIAMKDFLVATTSGLLQNVAVLDLIYQEEKRQNCEFVAVYLQKAQRLAYVNLNCNKISITEFEKLLNMSIQSCEVMASQMRKAVKRQIVENKNCFYLN